MSEPKGGAGPLSGVRIVDVTNVVFGAYATSILADLGADVIKVEAPSTPLGGGGGDVMRYPGHLPEGAAPAMGPIFLTINRNKRSIVIDLATEVGRRQLEALIMTADVFTSNMRMAVLERFGFGPDRLFELKPDLIYAHAAGYGRDGPYDGLPAYDDVIQAQSGFADLHCRADGNSEPRFVPSIIGDKSAGLFMAYATIAALFHRQRSGEGQLIEVPMFECLTSFMLVEHLFDQAFDPPTGDWTYTRITSRGRKPYRTADGFIAAMPYSDQNWRDFFLVTGAGPELTDDPRFQTYEARSNHYLEIYDALEPLLLPHATQYLIENFRAKGIPCAAVNRLEDLKSDPHLQAVNFFERRTHPDVGPYFALKHPVKFSRTPAGIRFDAPRLGQHTDEILTELGLK
jgi:crotonobetainyl-CoA:carnitine CoA-transferase CaiB-like acyl-CoA transferase